MHVAHSLGWFMPDSIGGTENHAAGLAVGMRAQGVMTSVLAFAGPAGARRYDHEGVPVFRYTSLGEPGDTDPATFAGALKTSGATHYHQHAWTEQCGLRHLRLARAMGLKTYLTVLVPNNLCLRGTLMLDGTAQCDGAIREDRCAACWLASKGFPAALGSLSHRVPMALSAPLARSRRGRNALAPLAARALARQKREDLLDSAALCDKVVVVAEWLRQALLANGIAPEKIALCRLGLDDGFTAPPRSVPAVPPARVSFFGRYDPVKGIDTLIGAVCALPGEVGLELSIYGFGKTRKDLAHRAELVALAAGDPRIRFEDSVPPGEVVRLMSTFHAVAVPSKWLETGPLVVLEAREARVPVFGSRLGGIAELIAHGEDGLLLPPFDVEAWAAAFRALAEGSLKLTGAYRSVRKMSLVSAETLAIYAAP